MSSETSPEPTRAGVSTPDELRDFVSKAGSSLLVVDLRHPDSTVEPEDVKSLAAAGLPGGEYRPKAVNLPWSRDAKSMELPSVDLDTPIITHCGGGGRGQMAKEYLMKNGFTNVLNGGGPREAACWAEYGSK
jgi:rhodanese-related sulfurtransferase